VDSKSIALELVIRKRTGRLARASLPVDDYYAFGRCGSITSDSTHHRAKKRTAMAMDSSRHVIKVIERQRTACHAGGFQRKFGFRVGWAIKFRGNLQ